MSCPPPKVSMSCPPPIAMLVTIASLIAGCLFITILPGDPNSEKTRHDHFIRWFIIGTVICSGWGIHLLSRTVKEGGLRTASDVLSKVLAYTGWGAVGCEILGSLMALFWVGTIRALGQGF